MNTQELDQLKAQLNSLKIRLFDMGEMYAGSEASVKQLQTFVMSIMETLELEIQDQVDPETVLAEIRRLKEFDVAVAEIDEPTEDAELIHG
ncbi:tail fiber chaperone [Morganella phage vB_MmoM_MP1]|uniref:Uncharacterized protein n=1 Tax=Morganella phage vB_MmoM_MP1 TaxID=1852628 RepID=A0A192YAN4_9CAUD|nr:tail fiber chaperone [Morganella phage vB_MmoM_MP1]ANM46592.1 hypothetical protein MP1_gp0138 [Morganella phage vB_MmoM_MP1]